MATTTEWTVDRWHGCGTGPAGVITFRNAEALHHNGATGSPIVLPAGTYGPGTRVRVTVELIEDTPCPAGPNDSGWWWKHAHVEAASRGAAIALGYPTGEFPRNQDRTGGVLSLTPTLVDDAMKEAMTYLDQRLAGLTVKPRDRHALNHKVRERLTAWAA